MNEVLSIATTKGGEIGVSFHCEGCKIRHRVPVENSKCIWDWNGDTEKPTLSPSIKTQFTNDDGKDMLCHSFVKDGNIQYLNDCTHELAGKTIPLPLIENE